MNFDLITKIVSYVEGLKITTSPKFVYNMTTNAMLLDRYMDYLVEHNFSILLSLDGDKEGDYLRVDKHNHASFDRVFSNIKKLQVKYPDFFAERISFNSLLNVKSSAEDIYNFIFREFGKTPAISSISINGVRKDKIDEFKTIYKSYDEQNMLSKMLKDKSLHYKDLGFFFYYHLENAYRQYCDLLMTKKSRTIKIPTGTCIPFFRKMFITSNGDILVCERIGLQHVLGHVSDKVDLDFDKVVETYNGYYSFIKQQCAQCYHADDCPECFLQFPFSSGGPVCPSLFDEERQKQHLGNIVSTLEDDPSCFNIVNKFVFA